MIAHMDLTDLGGLLVAVLCGGAVGLERQRSGHADTTSGDLHFAGLRTFTLLGLLGGIAGWLWRSEAAVPGAVLLGGAALLVAAAYVGASRRDVDGTTEVAALVVLAAAFLSGIGQSGLAGGLTAFTVLLLMEKTRLHGWVERVDDAEFRSGVRFAVMAAVVLPLLPVGPYGPGAGIKPRELWLIVLIITGLEFAGYIAQRRVGNRYGYTLAGALGGLISSTSVTLGYARQSRSQPESAVALASGAIAANATLLPRVALTALILNPPLGQRVALLFLLPLVVMLLLLVLTLHRAEDEGSESRATRNPMNVGPALQLAGIYQLAIYGIHFVTARLGSPGLLVLGLLLGVTDIDALTISVARRNGLADAVAPTVLPSVVVIGALGTTLFKLGVAIAVGRGAFRLRVATALAALALALAALLVLA